MLASMLLESAGFQSSGLSAKEAARYTAEDGAMLIAQESAMEMYEIFSNEFIAMEELEIRRYQATMEGVSVDDSVMEGIGSDMKEKAKAAFEKIKQMLIKLRDKVLEFLKNIKRNLDRIFMDGTAFAKKYEKDLMKLKLTGYKKDGFKYDIEKFANDVQDGYKKTADELLKGYQDRIKLYSDKDKPDATDRRVELGKEVYADEMTKFLNDFFGVSESSEVAEACWKKLRGGASDKTDTVEVDCSNITVFINVLKDSRKELSIVAKMDKYTKDVFSKAIKAVNDAATKAEKNGSSNNAALARAYSAHLSSVQTAVNTSNSQTYSAMVERVKFYKKVCVGAFTYKEDK